MEAILIFAIVSVIVNLIKASNKSETNKQRRKTKPFASPPFTSTGRDNRAFDRKPSSTIKKAYEVMDFEDNSQIGSFNSRQQINPYYPEEYDTSNKDEELTFKDEQIRMDLNELQRAVIMAEILNKPKALRK